MDLPQQLLKASKAHSLDTFQTLVAPYLTDDTFPTLKAILDNGNHFTALAALLLLYPKAATLFSDDTLVNMLQKRQTCSSCMLLAR